MSGYDLDAMRRLVDQCDLNIEMFERAIKDELTRKMEYQRIVRELEAKGDGSND
jgi:hypothetical protein